MGKTSPFGNALLQLKKAFGYTDFPGTFLKILSEPERTIELNFPLKLDSGEIEIWGDGRQTRSYYYIDDCIEATILLMESDYDKPINIGSDRLVSIDELADIIISIFGKKITKKYDLSAPQGVRGRNADLTLVKKVLGWQPRVNLEEGLKQTYEWINGQIKSTIKV